MDRLVVLLRSICSFFFLARLFFSFFFSFFFMDVDLDLDPNLDLNQVWIWV